ncbi:MAG: hypothetical protein Q4P72_06425 [Eubacteriales bacterium]|nr:hypothetical protein [Eubacteriales bacterium]
MLNFKVGNELRLEESLKLKWLITVLGCIHYRTRIPQKLRHETNLLFHEPLEDTVLLSLDDFCVTLNSCQNYVGLERAFRSFEDACGFSHLNELQIESWVILHSLRIHQNNQELLDSISNYWELLHESSYLRDVDAGIKNMIMSFAYQGGDDSYLSHEELLHMYRGFFKEYSTQLRLFKEKYLLPSIRKTWVIDFIQ